MDRKIIAERLRTLATDDINRSKAARLRDVIDDIEAALSAGVPRSSVVNELAVHGLEMTLATFETTLKRIRQKRSKQSIALMKSDNSSQDQALKLREVQPVIRPDNDPESAVVSSYNPADLDNIFGSKPDLTALAKFAKRQPK